MASHGLGNLGRLPDECWVRIFAHLEAYELSASASTLCSGALTLATHPQLWVSLLHLDFCASLPQRAMLQAWMLLHDQLHPRQLYIYKRREHSLDMDVARVELQQRGEQAREHERKQRRLRILNAVLARVTHLLLCVAGLGSSVALWLKLVEDVKCSFYVVFAPLMAFEVFFLASSAGAFAIYCLRGLSNWTFYWNRLRGAVRWLITYTSPFEGALVLVSACAVVPLAACALEGDLPELLLRDARLRLAPPFGAVWLAALLLACGLLRRRSFSASCVGSFALLWCPLVSTSILLYMKLSAVAKLPYYVVFAPTLGMTSLLLVFVGFLVVASFWLGYRGNRDWIEYATFTLLTLVTLLLPLLLLQLVLLARLTGRISDNALFVPLTLWLGCLTVCAACHACASLAGGPGAAPEHLPRPWRLPDREPSDTELLLPHAAAGVV